MTSIMQHGAAVADAPHKGAALPRAGAVDLQLSEQSLDQWRLDTGTPRMTDSAN
jgi:hypothetical protein